MSRKNEQLTVREPLDLRFLPDEGLELEEELPREWLEEQLSDPKSGAPVHANHAGHAALEIDPLGAVHTRPPIRIHGTLTATVATTCVRCLEPVEEPVAADVDVTLFPEGATQPKSSGGKDDEEEGLTDAEMDEGTYAENTIDLPAIVREAFLLEISMNPVCPDETACSTRTQAMLDEANSASEGAIPDRWAALRRLRDG